MSQLKKFNASENRNYNNSDAYEAGTLTWDPDNGLRIHDGNTGGGNQVGSSSVYWGDVQNRPYGASGVHDIFGGGASVNNGKFLMQTDTTTSAWTSLPTTYDTLTIDTKVIGGTVGDAGTKITGIEASLGSGAPYRYVFISGNDAFNNLFNRGTSIIGWKMYPASDPSAFVTITEYLNYDLGGPSLGFSGGLAGGPWVAESSDYNAGTPGPLTLSANDAYLILNTDGGLTLPGNVVNIKSNVTTHSGVGLGSVAGATVTIWTASSSDIQAARLVYRADINYSQNVEIGTVYAVKDSAGNVNVNEIDAAKSSAFNSVIISGGIDGDGKLYVTASSGTSDDANFLVSVTEFN
jgi:hypothetical protein